MIKNLTDLLGLLVTLISILEKEAMPAVAGT